MSADLCHSLRAVSASTRALICSKLNSCPILEQSISHHTAPRVLNTDSKAVATLLHKLQAAPYEALLSSEGCKVMLILTRDTTLPNTPCRCVIVNTAHRVVVSRMAFDATLFEGDTIFSGELVLASCTSRGGNRTFLVQDLLVLQGVLLVGNVAPSQRLALALDVVTRGHAPDLLFDEVRLSVKKACSTRNVGPLLEMAAGLPYQSLALLLRPTDQDGQWFTIPLLNQVPLGKGCVQTQRQTPLSPQPAPTKQSDTLVKAPSKHNVHMTRVLEVRRTDLPDVFEGRPVPSKSRLSQPAWEPMCVQTLMESRHMKNIFSKVKQAETTRLKCVFNTAFGRWGPLLGAPTPCVNSFPVSEVALDSAVDNGSGSVNPPS